MNHTLVARVEDHPGVLNRVASLFRRRAFNIKSLTVGGSEEVGPTSQPGSSPLKVTSYKESKDTLAGSLVLLMPTV